MTVLFISSGKSGNVSELIKNQGESLINEGIEVVYFMLNPGLWGYISGIPKIRKLYKSGRFNLAHAHYSLSAFAASIAGRFPLVVSLMGSDIYMSKILRRLTWLFYKRRWQITIVKTHQMKNLLHMDNALVIPNGVNLERFKIIPKSVARNYLNYPYDKKLIVFISVRNRPEKNLPLALKSIKTLNYNDAELMQVFDVPNTIIPYYLNAADALLLTSKWEGSVNVVKEAMACNCPIIATDVGDIKWIIGKTEGCYISSFNSDDIANKLKFVLDLEKRTNGRERIIELNLDSVSIARKIIEIYKGILAIK
jgi:glycosyltransferase involved in cell wall biosynthesis